MEIEEVAHDTPEKILREAIDPVVGLTPFQARKLTYGLGLSGGAAKKMITGNAPSAKVLARGLVSLGPKRNCVPWSA